ncbi:MAG: hypothetical protein HFI88_10185 [Lachnospiraceae bacterium]|nr:hypothetical protein [Lachnospiraceae bacterium]
MTKEQLEAYRSKKAEIGELTYRLNHFDDGDSMIGNDVVKDYRTGYPRPQSVVGYDYKRAERLRKTYRSRIVRLQDECLEVEHWVEAIPDSLTRRIFRMRYIDGMTQQKIARKVHMHQTAVSKKISIFLQME